MLQGPEGLAEEGTPMSSAHFAHRGPRLACFVPRPPNPLGGPVNTFIRNRDLVAVSTLRLFKRVHKMIRNHCENHHTSKTALRNNYIALKNNERTSISVEFYRIMKHNINWSNNTEVSDLLIYSARHIRSSKYKTGYTVKQQRIDN